MAEKAVQQREEPGVVHSTFVVERSYPHAPEVVFAAFADPAKKRRWWADRDGGGQEEFSMSFTPGGKERLVYRVGPGTPVSGMRITSEGTYEDIVENRRIVIAQTMSLEQKRISATLITIELVPTQQGTDLICTHQGAFFEGADGPERREQGWKALLERLGRELAA